METLNEEFEVLESIFPEEFTRIAERQVQFTLGNLNTDNTSPEDTVVVQLDVVYPDEYPAAAPEFKITTLRGCLDEQELSQLLASSRAMAEQSLGEASTFTVVSHLTDELGESIRSRTQRLKEEGEQAEQKALQAEAQRLKGTTVTPASFGEWRANFLNEMKLRKNKEQDERLKGLGGKEREEFRKVATRLTGRQLFEKNRLLDESDALPEDGVVSVDFSQFVISEGDKEEEQAFQVTFEDSD